MGKVVTNELAALIDILPPHIQESLQQQPDRNELLEVILDIGRLPEARSQIESWFLTQAR